MITQNFNQLPIVASNRNSKLFVINRNFDYSQLIKISITRDNSPIVLFFKLQSLKFWLVGIINIRLLALFSNSNCFFFNFDFSRILKDFYSSSNEINRNCSRIVSNRGNIMYAATPSGTKKNGALSQGSPPLNTPLHADTTSRPNWSRIKKEERINLRTNYKV